MNKITRKDKILIAIIIGLLLFLVPDASANTMIIYLIYAVFTLVGFKANLLLYIVMMPWETQLLTPLGTFFRTAMVIIFLKWLYIMVIQKRNITIKFDHRLEVAIIIMLTVYALLAVVYFQNLATIYIVFSILIFLLFRSNDPDYDNLAKYYILFTVFGVIWGLWNNNFMFSEVDGELANRFSGTYEPNFMSIYINLAIVMCLYNWRKFNKIFLVIALGWLYSGLLLTMSTTGTAVNIAVLAISFCYYLYQQPSFSSRFIKSLLTLVLLLTTIGIVYQIPTVYLLTKRIELKVEAFINGDTSEATTGRSDITAEYNILRLQENNRVKIFGSAHPEPRVYYEQRRDTHNSYFDLEITYGLLGLGVLLIFFVRRFTQASFMMKMLLFVLLAGVSSVSLTTFPFFWLLLFI